MMNFTLLLLAIYDSFRVMGQKQFKKIAKVFWIITIFLIALSLVGFMVVPYF